MDWEGTKWSKLEVKQVVVGMLEMEEAALGFGSDMTWSMTMGEAEVRWRTRHLMGKWSTNLEASSVGRLPCGF